MIITMNMSQTKKEKRKKNFKKGVDKIPFIWYNIYIRLRQKGNDNYEYAYKTLHRNQTIW